MIRYLDSGNYYGETIDQLRLENAILSESVYMPNSCLPNHYHKNFYVCYVLEGSYQERHGAKSFQCNKGNIIIHPKSFEHANQFSYQKSRCFNIEIYNLTYDEAKQPALAYQNFRHASLQAILEKIYTEFKYSDSFSPLIIEGLTFEMLGRLYRVAKSLGPYWLKKVKEMVLDSNKLLSLSTVAASLQVSASHVAREFKRDTGITFGEYVRQVRIQQACQILGQDEADILQVALQFGFADQSHFTRTFKRVMQVTPLQYKKMMK